MGGLGGYLEGYTGVLPSTLPGPIFRLNLASRPYLRPNEGFFRLFYEVSEIGPRIGSQNMLELTQN